MGKFYGVIGYAITTEEAPGVWKDSITERNYYGDVLQKSVRWQNSGNVNDDLTVGNKISVVADAYAYEHFSSIKYVSWMGVLWKVTTIEPQRPRLILTLGGEYNGQKA